MKFMNFDAHVQSVFNNDANDYMAFQSLMQDYARGTQEVSAKEANEKIVELFRATLGLTKDSRPVEVRRAIRRNQALVFDILEETMENMIVTDWGKGSEFFKNLVDNRNLALGDKNEFYVPDDSILSVMRIANGSHEIIRQRIGAGRVFSVSTYWVGLKVFADFERVLLGNDDFSALIAKVYDAYQRYINDTIYSTFTGYFATLAGTYKKTGTLTAANLRELCDNVSISNGGAEVQIYGTRAALRGVTALQNASYISNPMKEEFNATGLIGTWESYKLVEIPQSWQKNKVGTKKIDDEMLFIMPVNMTYKPICFVNEGEMQIATVTDKEQYVDMSYDMEVQTKLGCAMRYNAAYGMYDTTAISG